jgi:hypothetical protein
VSTLEWAELEEVSADIAALQSQRQAAKMMGSVERANVLGNKLARAVTRRDALIQRISERIGGVDGQAGQAPHWPVYKT